MILNKDARSKGNSIDSHKWKMSKRNILPKKVGINFDPYKAAWIEIKTWGKLSPFLPKYVTLTITILVWCMMEELVNTSMGSENCPLFSEAN